MNTERKEINEKTILHKSGNLPEVVIGIIVMSVTLLFMIAFGYSFFVNFDSSDGHFFTSIALFISIEFGFLGLLFGYFFGYRTFNSGYQEVKKIKNGEYTVRKDMVVGVRASRDSDNDTIYLYSFENCREELRLCSSNSLKRGEEVYLVIGIDNKLITHMPMSKYYLPGHEDEEAATVVNIAGETVVVGEEEAKEKAYANEVSRALIPIIIISAIAGIAIAIFTKAVGCGFLSAIVVFNVVLAFIGRLNNLERDIRGKHVQATLSDVKKYDGWSELTYTFDYKGETVNIVLQDSKSPHKGRVFDAYYVPSNGHLYIDEAKDKKERNKNTNAPLYIIALIVLIPAIICGLLHI